MSIGGGRGGEDCRSQTADCRLGEGRVPSRRVVQAEPRSVPRPHALASEATGKGCGIRCSLGRVGRGVSEQ
jgi:hypothetical protein